MISVPIPLTPSTVSHPATSIPPSNLPSRFAANRGSIQASEGENPSGLDRSGKASMGDKADPRMPSAARPYVAPLINPNDLPPDYSSLLAIIFGIAGVMLRVSNALPITLHSNFFLCGRVFSDVLKEISLNMSCACASLNEDGSYPGG